MMPGFRHTVLTRVAAQCGRGVPSFPDSLLLHGVPSGTITVVGKQALRARPPRGGGKLASMRSTMYLYRVNYGGISDENANLS